MEDFLLFVSSSVVISSIYFWRKEENEIDIKVPNETTMESVMNHFNINGWRQYGRINLKRLSVRQSVT